MRPGPYSPLGPKGEWFRKWVSERDLTTGHWPQMRLADSLDRVNVPVLIHAGWQDIFLQQSLEQYYQLRERGLDVAMTVGPWEHLDIEAKAASMLMAENFDWLTAHFSGTRVQRSAPVKVFVTGADEWRDHSAWPPETASKMLHLQPGGQLGDQACESAASASFTYNPADPTPSIGGRLMFSLGGYTDDGELARRRDILAFTSPVLESAVEIAGTPVVRLNHGSDNPHADIFARSGTDVVKALALGASAVGVGRSYAYALALGGEDGLIHHIRSILAEADLLMAIDGYPTIADLRSEGAIRRVN